MYFEFAKATEITEFAKENHPDTYGDNVKVFIVPDVTDYHILRIIEGYGKDYKRIEGSFILEWQKLSKAKGDKITSTKKLDEILEEDDGGNWAYQVLGSLEECIENVSGGFGFA